MICPKCKTEKEDIGSEGWMLCDNCGEKMIFNPHNYEVATNPIAEVPKKKKK